MKKRQISEIGTTSLQGTKATSPKHPLLGGSTVLHILHACPRHPYTLTSVHRYVLHGFSIGVHEIYGFVNTSLSLDTVCTVLYITITWVYFPFVSKLSICKAFVPLFALHYKLQTLWSVCKDDVSKLNIPYENIKAFVHWFANSLLAHKSYNYNLGLLSIICKQLSYLCKAFVPLFALHYKL